MKRLVAIITLLLIAGTAWAAVTEAPLKLGVLAYRPKPQTLAQWQPLAAYLQATLQRPVELSAYDQAELAGVASARAVDVVITTPSHFISLQQSSGLSSPLATMVTRQGTHELSRYGGVIFTRTDRGDISSLADLAGKRIAAATPEAFGGYQMQALELVEAGVALPSGNRLLLTGQPHDRVIEAVLAGRADAGFVRAGLLELLAQEGKLEPGRVKVINRQNLPDFPFAVSTRLYPEWPVVVMPQIDSALASRLAAALFLLPHGSFSGPAADIHGFAIPANYASVENLLRRLRLPPFDRAPEFTLADLWHRHAPWISALAGLFLLLALTSAGLVVLYRRSRQSLREVERLAEKEELLLTSLAEGVYGVDPQGRCIFVNPRALAMLGFAEGEVIGQDAHHLFHDRGADGSSNAGEECPVMLSLRDGRKRELEDVFIAKDGAAFPVSLAVSAMRHSNSIVGAVVAFQDISERKQADRARLVHLKFLESLDRVNRATQGANDLHQMMSDTLKTALSIFACDRTWLFYPCDPEAPTFRVPMEITRPEYPGAGILDAEVPMSPDMALNVRESLESAGPVTYGVGTERPINQVSREQFGVQSMMMVALYPKSGKPWLFGLHQCSFPRVWTAEEQRLFQEIGRRLADALTGLLSLRDIQESAEKYRRLQEYLQLQIDRLPIGLIVWDSEFRATAWNPGAAGIFGFTAEEALGKHPYDFIVPQEAQAAVDAIWSRLIKGDMTAYSENENITKDGRTILCDWTNTPLHDAGGATTSVLSMVQDITERKRAEEKILGLNEELEQRVKERTRELERRNHELEEMNKAFVGRELRMVELKERIKALEQDSTGNRRLGTS